MNIPLALIGILVFFVVCAVFGLILLKISMRKNPQSTLRTVRETVIGAVAGAVAAFSLSVVEISGDDKLVLLFGILILFCMIFFILGVLCLVIVYFEGEAR